MFVSELLFSASILSKYEPSRDRKRMEIFTYKKFKTYPRFNLVLQRKPSQNMLGLMAIMSLHDAINMKLVRDLCHPSVVANIFSL